MTIQVHKVEQWSIIKTTTEGNFSAFLPVFEACQSLQKQDDAYEF